MHSDRPGAPFQAFFLPGAGADGGQRLCIYHPPQAPRPLGLVLYLHPFAEEMNKARRMAALQSRAFARQGYGVLQVDLFGCGDSSGDFGDATWGAWVADAVQAAAWLRRQGDAPLWFWGLRAGCLLAAAAAARMQDPPSRFVFWQPTPSGKTLLQQFLRLKMAAELQGGQAKQVMEGLRASLAAGQAVEIAGYALSPGLAQGLEAATLEPPAQAARLEWIEVSTRADASHVMPASQIALQKWADAGCAVRSQVANGPAFWQTTEIEDAPALIAATLAAVGHAETAVPAAPLPA